MLIIQNGGCPWSYIFRNVESFFLSFFKLRFCRDGIDINLVCILISVVLTSR